MSISHRDNRTQASTSSPSPPPDSCFTNSSRKRQVANSTEKASKRHKDDHRSWPNNNDECDELVDRRTDMAPVSSDTEQDRKIRSVAPFWTNIAIKTPAHDQTIGIVLRNCSRLDPRWITAISDELPLLPCAGLSLHRLQLFADIQDQDTTNEDHFCSGRGMCTFETGHPHLPRKAGGFISRLDFERSLVP